MKECPCINCLVQVCCKNKAKEDIFGLGYECILFHDYLIEFYEAKGMIRLEGNAGQDFIKRFIILKTLFL
jgi:hypothetical protein